MLTITHTIKDENGIHARPAGLLAEVSKKFSSDIVISGGGKTANAKKIFEVMSLCLKCNDKIVISIKGDDEKNAFDEIAVFLEGNL